ncbi:MAG: heparan-alpha-glucosaminide N-acetyltransferase [Desulfitobacteriaceae bacterium]|nr:heparan-alpha-glucosaminide N-acetyltransferase [Desulfitobacteriaceae bacterium]MDD4346205.1 heparan-alpha-glucosaminide N-acetyltransferase [Desulfitobacteriaceae bacterium]MDD4400859.1 heparan-alpha-glucosaminide N-acetyltransferase [Desulfitobacteriaceae bacterium]
MGNRRIWELDLLRTLAIILMITFHTVFDLNNYVGINIKYQSGFWFWEGKISALLFIFLAGISSGFSKGTVRRGIKVFLFGMAITLVTYILFGEQYTRFGILHLLGVGMALFPVLKRINNIFLFLMTVIFAFAAIPVKHVLAETGLLLPFGIMYSGFATLDYYPLVPYLSVFILGVLVYKLFYYKRQSIFTFDYKNKYLSLISRNSLAIYLIHQPIIIALISLILIMYN